MADLASDKLGSATPVVGLFNPACPAAIRGAVRSVHVDAIDCVSRWTFAHVVGESGVVAPAFTDANPPAAIVLPFLDLGISAPLPHAAPDTVEAGFRQPMGAVASFKHFSNDATARSGVSRAEMRNANIHRIAANADAAPTDASVWKSFAFTDYRKSAKGMSRKIKFSHPKIVENNAGVCNAR